VALFQWEPRGATLTVRALAEVTVGAVSAILIAAMPTVQNIDLLVVVGAGATAVWSPLLFYPPEREREQHGLLRRLYRELERCKVDP
jgi:hypothetical protein